MGAYSELDIEKQYGDDAFAEDDAFFEDDEDCCGAAEFEPADAGEQQAETTPPPSPPASVQGAEPAQADAAKSAADKAAEEDAKRKAHEEAESKRKAEWEEKQAKKKAEEQKKLDELAAMSVDELLAASTRRVSMDIEKLTRRNMKERVAEHIQTLCLENPAFARLTMHPRKNIIHCIWYINRKAYEFLKQEMKDNGFKPENGVYGSDVPDDLCYQWAVDYFNDPDAEEDHRDEEKFVPKPYPGASAKPPKNKGKAKKADAKKKEADTPAAEKKPQGNPDGQLSLLGVA